MNSVCSICLDSIDNDIYKTQCNHMFHYKCFYTYARYKEFYLTCPNCLSYLYVYPNNLDWIKMYIRRFFYYLTS